LRPPESYIEAAKEAEKKGKTLDAIRYYLLAGSMEPAIKQAIASLRGKTTIILEV
jgi:hypothetical protein